MPHNGPNNNKISPTTSLRPTGREAFTLIELLVVIAIVGMLASIFVLLDVGVARAKGRDSQRVANIKQLSTALDLYYNDNNGYPVGVYYSGWDAGNYPAGQPNCWCRSVSSEGVLKQALVTGGYVSKLPDDPISREGDGNYLSDGQGRGYLYISDGKSYVLGTYLEMGSGPSGSICIVAGNYQVSVGNFSGSYCPQPYTVGASPTPTPTPTAGGTPTPTPTPSSGSTPTPTPSGTGMIYIISGTHIEVFDSTGTYQFEFGGTGSGNGQFQLPSGITTDSAGNVLVTDALLNRVQKFDSNGVYILQFGSTGSAAGSLYQPYGISMDLYGNIWVADTGNNRIQEFSAGGTFLKQLGGLGGGDGQFVSPIGVVIDSGNNIWVSDTGNNRVQKFSAVGSSGAASTVTFLLKFGSLGNGNGQFNVPYGIAMDSFGNPWEADSQNSRMQVFTPSGSFVKVVTGPFSYPSPYSIAFDSAGNAWALDYNANQVLEFNGSTGAKIFTFGTTGGGPGQLFHPTYMAIH